MIAPGAIEEFDRLLASGAFAGATRQALDLQRLQPRGALPLLLQVDVDLCQGRNDAARRLLAKALGSDIDGPHTALRLMQVLDRLSESGLMIEVAGQLPPPMWGSATQLAQAAHVLTGVGAFALARQYAHAAVAKDGRNPPALYALATLETFYGDLAGAAELCTRCLAILPDDAGAFWLLSRLRQPGGGVRIDRLRSLLAASTSVEDRVWYGYALHNELHELGDHEASWAALAEACATKRALLGDGIGRYGDLLDALLAAEDWPQPAAATPIAAAPVASLRAVFVIGLHRSGTTLAEQVLAGHPSVAAGGETYDIRAQLRRVTRLHYPHELDTRVIAQRHAIDFPALGRHYLRGMSWRAEGKPVVTDKLPSNYLNLGLIANALPDARFIHLRRDPVDVGFSSLRTLFSHACPYSYDPLDFARHHHRYQRLMAHWRQRFPDRILDVDYDDLVSDPVATATRMARFVGLDFTPTMVALEQRTNAVATASSVMMRDGIRRDRGKVWAPYARRLAPMIEALSAPV